MATLFYKLFKLPLFFVLFLFPSKDSVSFQLLPTFYSKSSNILCHGDAGPLGSAVEMNKDIYQYRVGWVTYVRRVQIWDSKTGNVSHLSCNFSFIIDTRGSSDCDDGFAFFLAPVGFEIPPNSAGGFLGLFNTTTTTDSSLDQIVLVEFDSFVNPEWDPPVQHVGINNSIFSAVYTPWNASLHSADTIVASILYNATTKNLSVFWAYQRTSTPHDNTSLSYNIDLSKVLPEWVTIGFAPATGSNVERHTLLSWEFSSSLEIKETGGNKEKGIRLIVGLTITGGVLEAAVIIGFAIFRRQKQKEREKAVAMNLALKNDDLEKN